MNWISGAGSLVALAMLGGCAMFQPKSPAAAPAPRVEPKVIDTSCQWVHVLRPSCGDVIGDDFARQIVEQNQAGVEHGCWKKPAASACPVSVPAK